MRLGSSINPPMVRLTQQPSVWPYLRLVAVIALIFLTVSSSALHSQPKITAQGPRKTTPHK